jgi:hypothetical protein
MAQQQPDMLTFGTKEKIFEKLLAIVSQTSGEQ